MADSPKVTHFESFETLVQAIEDDKTSRNVTARRYPIRPILFDSFESFRKLVRELTLYHNVAAYNIEDLLEDDDFWISSDVLIDKIMSINEDTIISPFSEIVRFYTEEKFNAFFHTIMVKKENDINHTGTRIYLPLIGIDIRFNKFIDSMSREIGPVWELDEEDPLPIDITLVPSEFSVPENIHCVKTTKEWLEYWQRDDAGDTICSSRPLNLFYKNSQPDKLFSITQVSNAYMFIKRFYSDSIEIPYAEKDKEYWSRLLKELQARKFKSLDFRKITCDVLNLQHISVGENFIPTWVNLKTDFHRWLLAKYFTTYKSIKFPYLKHVIDGLESYDATTLSAHIFNDIFEIDNYEEYFEERATYISSMSIVKIGQENEDILKTKLIETSSENFAKARDICGSTFLFERELLLQWYAEGRISLDWIRSKYPEAYAYFGDYTFENQKFSQSWIVNYMAEYKKAKVKDIYTDELSQYVKKYNADEQSFFEWYEDFEKNCDLRVPSEHYDHVYWIDALGIEWMPLIQYYLEGNQAKMRIEHAFVGATGLPTSTYHNPQEHDTKISSLDELVHGDYYVPYRTLAKEIALLKEIVDEVSRQKPNRRILIVSDHGLTSMSRLTPSKKYEKKASHEGRYIQLDKPCELADNDYLRFQNGDDNFIIALRHNSLNKLPVREVHGGCTPEEVLVPFIVLTNKEGQQGFYDITLCKNSLDIASPTIAFMIDYLSPDEKKLPRIKYNGIIDNLQYYMGSWNTTLKGVSAGKLNVEVLVDDFKQTFTVEIKSGIEEDDLFMM